MLEEIKTNELTVAEAEALELSEETLEELSNNFGEEEEENE